MKTFETLFLLSSILPFFLTNTYAVDTITTSQSMKDGDTLVSSGGSFEMGFFSPGNSLNRYVGIWYNNIPDFTVAWVANRQVPVTSKSGILKLNARALPGYLTLVDASNGNSTIWSSPPPTGASRVARNPVVQLLDTGNLVVREEDDTNPDNFYWQSFDYPTDTLMARMKVGVDLKTGFERYLSSWKSDDDPAPGDYTFHLDPTGYPQLMLRKNSVEYYRLGSWNGLHLSGMAIGTIPANEWLIYSVAMDGREVYYSFEVRNNSSLSRLSLSKDGKVNRWRWISGTKNWTLYLSVPQDNACDMYSRCGVYSTCSTVICECLDKFVPQNQSEWDTNNWKEGCTRKQNLDCRKGDGFRKYSSFNWPDTKSSWYNKSMRPDECAAVCLNNCSCMGYTTLDMRTGTGCLFWLGDLIDMKALARSDQDIYVRMSSTDSDEEFNSGRKKGAKIKVILPIIFAGMVFIVLSLSLFSYARKRKKARLMQEGGSMHGNWKNTGNQRHGEDLELPLFDLATIHNATSSFSFDNKLGEGGFGPVYKGVLESGQEIAVKRLSRSSNQGLNEFKNEVICISKLQHRNLVKLLGCCIQGDEKMLIYEFMPNKSLDSFIFDRMRSLLLDWSKRFHIINGIARGLLYLHQDSRLRIIHRDLKASNVLLDYEMNPKISDFGMARSFGGNETQASTQRVVGTYGYMSPEYAVDGIFSTKSDVFSFGVLVLEIVSGMRNRGFVHHDHHHNLLGHVWRLYSEGRSLELMEAIVTDMCHFPEVLRAIQVGLLCVQESPEDRPSMSSVVLMLGSECALPRPKQPGFFTERNIIDIEYSSRTQPASSVCELSDTLIYGR